MKLSEKAIEKPVPVIVTLALIFIASVISYINLPVELVPRIEIPYAIASVVYPGAAPKEIEQEIIKPVEERLSQLSDYEDINSWAMQNMAIISVKFSADADLDESIDDFREKVNEALPDLPDEVEDVNVMEVAFDDMPISILNLYGDFRPDELRDLGEKVKDELIRVKGVNHVELFGGLKREISVSVDPGQLASNHITLPQIIAALKKNNVNLPGGTLKLSNRDILVRTVGKFNEISQIGGTILGVSPDGSLIRVRDVGNVIDGLEEPKNLSRYGHYPSVTILISKKAGAHVVETTENIEKTVENMIPSFPPGLKYDYTSRQATDVERQSEQLATNASWGIVFVVMVLFFGIGFRNSLIVSIALPFSLMMAFLFMPFFDIDRTGIAMFGLIMVLGIVVDGAIIVAESTYRHIEEGLDRKAASVQAIREVGIPILTSVVTTMVAFAPIMYMTGIMGQFLSVIPKVVIFTLVGAFLADHFMIPVITSKFMRISTNRGYLSGNWFGRRYYLSTLDWALRHRLLTISIAFTIFLASLVVVGISMSTDTKLIKVQAFPKVPQPRITIDIDTGQGSHLEYTDEVVKTLERYLDQMVEVDRYVSTIGESGVQNVRLAQGGGSGPEIAQINVDLVTSENRSRSVEEIIGELDARFGTWPGTEIRFGLIQEGPPIVTDIVLDISGDDLVQMENIANKIKNVLETIPGALNVSSSLADRRSEFQVQVDHDRAATYGLSSEDISNTVAAALFGLEATSFSDGLEDIPVRVKLDVSGGNELNAVQSLKIPSMNGTLVPFNNVASLKLASGETVIRHHNFKRSVSVTCEIAEGMDASDITRKLDPYLASMYVPAGISVKYGGVEDEASKSFKSLAQAMIIGFAIIIVILSLQFKSLRQPLIIALAVPLSFVGVVIGLAVTRVAFGLMAFFGVVALMGVVVNDAIVLISYVNDLRRDGMSLKDALVKGGSNRLRPIILTTVTTLAGMIPLTLNFGGGGEYWRPLAVSLIFGLAIASVLTLVIVPVFYHLLESGGERKRIRLLKK